MVAPTTAKASGDRSAHGVGRTTPRRARAVREARKEAARGAALDGELLPRTATAAATGLAAEQRVRRWLCLELRWRIEGGRDSRAVCCAACVVCDMCHVRVLFFIGVRRVT